MLCVCCAMCFFVCAQFFECAFCFVSVIRASCALLFSICALYLVICWCLIYVRFVYVRGAVLCVLCFV